MLAHTPMSTNQQRRRRWFANESPGSWMMARGYAKKVIDGEEEQNEKHQIRKGIKKFLP